MLRNCKNNNTIVLCILFPGVAIILCIYFKVNMRTYLVQNNGVIIILNCALTQFSRRTIDAQSGAYKLLLHDILSAALLFKRNFLIRLNVFGPASQIAIENFFGKTRNGILRKAVWVCETFRKKPLHFRIKVDYRNFRTNPPTIGIP